MRGLALTAVVDSMRQVLAVVIALLAIAGAAFLGSHKLSNPDHYQYGGCFSRDYINNGWPLPCRPPTRAAWQIPLALLIGVGGLAAAVLITSKPRRPRQLTAYRPPA